MGLWLEEWHPTVKTEHHVGKEEPISISLKGLVTMQISQMCLLVCLCASVSLCSRNQGPHLSTQWHFCGICFGLFSGSQISWGLVVWMGPLSALLSRQIYLHCDTQKLRMISSRTLVESGGEFKCASKQWDLRQSLYNNVNYIHQAEPGCCPDEDVNFKLHFYNKNTAVVVLFSNRRDSVSASPQR